MRSLRLADSARSGGVAMENTTNLFPYLFVVPCFLGAVQHVQGCRYVGHNKGLRTTSEKMIGLSPWYLVHLPHPPLITGPWLGSLGVDPSRVVVASQTIAHPNKPKSSATLEQGTLPGPATWEGISIFGWIDIVSTPPRWGALN